MVGKAHKPGNYRWIQRIWSVGGRKEEGQEMRQKAGEGWGEGGPEACWAYERGGFHPKPKRKGSSTSFTQQVAGRAQPEAQVPRLLFCPHTDHRQLRVPLPGTGRDRGLDTN